MRYREQFYISMAEWRIIAILGVDAPISVSQLAREAGIDRGQLSRTMSVLVERGLVSRQPALVWLTSTSLKHLEKWEAD